MDLLFFEILFGPHVNAKGYHLLFNARMFKGASLAVTLCLYEKKKKKKKRNMKKKRKKKTKKKRKKKKKKKKMKKRKIWRKGDKRLE